MKDIKIVEVNMSGNKHSMFNSALLVAISTITDSRNIAFYSELGHQMCIKDFLRKFQYLNINYFDIKVVDKGGGMLPIKFFFEIYNVIKILFINRKNNYLLILTSVSTFSIFFIKLIKLFFRSTKLIIFLHGELEFIKPQKNFMLKFFGFFLKLSFKVSTDKNTRYFVLSDIIKTNLTKYKIINESFVGKIDHPYIYNEVEKNKKSNCKLKLGAIGVASELKNSHYIFKIANKNLPNIELEIIGQLLPNMSKFLQSNVTYFDGNKMIVQEVFEKKIADLDFALFFYDNKYYELCASGAFFDAINYEIPILGLKNDFFNYYFEMFGPMGYLFDTVGELIDFLENYENRRSTDYHTFLTNIKVAKGELSLKNIAIQLKEECKYFINFD